MKGADSEEKSEAGGRRCEEAERLRTQIESKILQIEEQLMTEAEAPPLAERSTEPALDVLEITDSVGDVVTTAIQRRRESAIALN